MDPVIVIAAGAAALSIILIVLSITGVDAGSAVNSRLERYMPHASQPGSAAPRKSFNELLEASQTMDALNRVIEQQGFGASLARAIARADLRLRASEYLVLWGITIVAVPVSFLVLSIILPVLGSTPMLLVGALLGVALPYVYLGRRRRKRLAAFNAQLADTITLLGNALRSGSSFPQAAERIVREADPPISVEFGRMLRELQLGLPFETALANMTRRMKSDDLELMASAIELNRQFGGNLAEILDSIAYTIRERVRIEGEIKALTAQQRLSGYVLAFMPIALSAFLMLFAPKFFAPMFEKPPELIGLPAGIVLLGFGGVMMGIGFSIIQKIVDIDV